MAKKRQEDTPPPGSPAWMATFGDLMNLLLCFFVLLFASSTVDQEKFEQIVASFTQSFNIFNAGSTAIGDGILISNGVSQLNELDEYINSTGKLAENNEDAEELDEEQSSIEERIEAAKLERSEELAELIEEAVNDSGYQEQIDVNFTSQYVQLTLNGAILFDSGRAEIKVGAVPILEKAGVILERYATSTVEVEGHTDSVPITGGRYANNNELSSARALSIFDFLVENTNLNPADIKHSGRGEYLPIADNSTEEGRAMNRRVEIKIYHELSGY